MPEDAARDNGPMSEAKAEAAGERYPQAWVIGSDQVADLDGPVHLRFGPHEGSTALYYASFFGGAVRRIALPNPKVTRL